MQEQPLENQPEDRKLLQDLVLQKISECLVRHDERGAEEAAHTITLLFLDFYHKLQTHCDDARVHDLLGELVQELRAQHHYRGKATY